MNFGGVDQLSVLLWAEIVMLWAVVNYLLLVLIPYSPASVELRPLLHCASSGSSRSLAAAS